LQVTNPCDDYEYIDTAASTYGISSNSKPPAVLKAGVEFLSLKEEMPDILFCQFELHEDMRKLWQGMKSDIYGHSRNSGRAVLPHPLEKRPTWKEETYWSARNRPVWKHGKFPCVFNWNMEPNWPQLLPGYTFSVNDIHGGNRANGLTLYLPEAGASLLNRKYKAHNLVRTPEIFDVEAAFAKKRFFAGFMYRNCGIFEDAIVRVTFFHLLSEGYKKVTALSDCRSETRSAKEEEEVRTVMREAPASFNGDWFVGMDEAAAIFQPYKFGFGMDNSAVPGALSEKLVNAYFAPSIPIFYGGVDIAQHLNKNAFVYCNITYRQEWEKPVWRAAHAKADWFPLSGQFSYEVYQRAEKEMKITDMRVANLKPLLKKGAQPCIDQVGEQYR
jgi:hypothetical protein